MRISIFSCIKNEVEFIGYSIMSILDYVDEIVYSDGNSTDGTIEVIEHIQNKYDKDNKVKLFKNMDFKNFTKDYVNKFNWTLKQCTGDYIMYLHPDMIVVNPDRIKKSLSSNGLRYNVNMVSIAGENRDKIFSNGRGDKWALIYKNDLGLHFHGCYGSPEEDLYFRDITGNEHKCYLLIQYLPYQILNTDIKINHYCECKNYHRRLNKMFTVLHTVNPLMDKASILQTAESHPRVTLEDKKYMGINYKFIPNTLRKPEVFNKYEKEFKKFSK